MAIEMTPTATPELMRKSISMPQQSVPNPSAAAGDGTTDVTIGGGTPVAEPHAPSGLPVERSRFSQWLASFGLGEMPTPLLTRRHRRR